MAKKPFSMLSYVPYTSKVHAMDRTLDIREAILHVFKDNLVMDENRMKQQTDWNISKHYFV